MKSKFLFSFLMLATVVLATGCGGGGDDDTPTPPTPVNPSDPSNPSGSYTLSLSVTSLSFDQGGGQQSVTVTTNAPSWSAESNQSWCKVQKNGNSLQVTAEANTGSEQRTASVTVTATGVSQPQTITVTQANDAGEYCRTDVPDEWVFNCEALSIAWVLVTNIDNFEVTSSEPWLKGEVTAIPNSDNKQLRIEAESYEKKDAQGQWLTELPRIATVMVKGGKAFSRTIKVVQNSHIYFHIPTTHYPFVNGSLVMSPDGDSKEVMVETNCYSWTPRVVDADWLTVKRVDSYTLLVTSTARAADDNTCRMAQIYIENDSDPFNNVTINVRDAESGISGEDYRYDGNTGWD